jgi:hypothetical protein
MKLVTETELGTVTKKEYLPNNQINQQNLIANQPARRGNRKALIKNIRLLNQLGEELAETPILGFNEQVTLILEIHVCEVLPAIDRDEDVDTLQFVLRAFPLSLEGKYLSLYQQYSQLSEEYYNCQNKIKEMYAELKRSHFALEEQQIQLEKLKHN